MERRPRVVAISGVKNSGKTSLIVRLLPELCARGLRVATVKHDGHRFEADRPGTDSFRHLEAGAVGTVIYDAEKYQLVRRVPVDEEFLIAQFPEADLILLEGFKETPWPKLEIVRAAVSERPVSHPSTLLALVTDRGELVPGCPVYSPDDIGGIAELLLRFTRLPPRFSGILLSGGFSSRMGSSKAELPFGGRTMLRYQLERLRMLGLGELLIAGGSGGAEGARAVPDLVPHRGPLSGIHAGLAASSREASLVLSVDAPLVPFFALFSLLERHRGGATVLEHGGRTEPLIGVYDRALAPVCAELLKGPRSSVKALFDAAGVEALPCAAEELLLSNCNTPEEYRSLLARLTAP